MAKQKRTRQRVKIREVGVCSRCRKFMKKK